MSRLPNIPGVRLSRRDVLRLSLAGFGLHALQPLANAGVLPGTGRTTAQNVFVIVNLKGGNDGVNTVVPATLGNYATRRGSLALPTESLLSMNAGRNATAAYMLHPALPNLAQLWAEGSVAVVRRVGYPTANLSHFTSMDVWADGVRGGFAPLGIERSGWIARYASMDAPTSLGAVSVGMGRPRTLVGGTSNPLLVDNLASFRFLSDGSYRINHSYRLEIIRQILANSNATGLSAENRQALEQSHALTDRIQAAVDGYQSTVTYTTESPSKYLRDIAIMLQAGFETRLFYTGFGGFDTHGSQGGVTGRHASLLARLDDALGSFAQDLKNMGCWNQTVIAVISEFGRRNYINGSGGTDHGAANHVLLLGGGVQGGMFGPDLTEQDLEDEYPSYEVDFRSIYKEILDVHLGASDVAAVFPEQQEKNVVLGLF